MSTTATGNDAVPVLPCESVALQVTVVVPSAKVEPDAGVHTTSAIGPSTSSVAVGVEKFTTEPLGPFASTLMAAGTLLSTGGV